jgi:hypothetical protein
MWQKEVENGFNTMVVKLYPLINQVTLHTPPASVGLYP